MSCRQSWFSSGFLFTHCCNNSQEAYTEYDTEVDGLWLIAWPCGHRWLVEKDETSITYRPVGSVVP